MPKLDVGAVETHIDAKGDASPLVKEVVSRLGPRFKVPASLKETTFRVNSVTVIPAVSVRNGRFCAFPVDEVLINGIPGIEVSPMGEKLEF